MAWIYILPRLKHYHIRSEILSLDDGNAATHRLVKVPNQEIVIWDSTHDASGRLFASPSEKEEGAVTFKE